MSALTDRMMRAAQLDVALYEEVEADESLTQEAMQVVVMSSVAAGIGTLSTGGIMGLIGGTIIALIGWGIWAWLTFMIGTNLLPEEKTEADLGQLLRTTGYASAPGVIRVVGIVPGFGILSAMIAGIWMLVAMIVAVRQALDYESTGRAVLVCVIGWGVQVVISVVLATVFGIGAAVVS